MLEDVVDNSGEVGLREVAPVAAPAPIIPGLIMRIDISPGQVRDPRVQKVIHHIWEDTAEDIAEMLTKRLGLKENLGVKSSYQSNTNGKVTLTLTMAPDA